MARVLLDTTVIIDVLRGRHTAERLRTMRRVGDEPWTCAISVEEIWRGLFAEERSSADRLVRGLRIAPLGASEGKAAGTWRRDFASRGVSLHQADCLIAAAAVAIGARLATANPKDFPMPELIVEHWPTG